MTQGKTLSQTRTDSSPKFPLEVRGLLKTVKKKWGNEFWIANTPQYAGKILLIRPKHQTSLHHHPRKHETLLVYAGCMRLDIEGGFCRMIAGQVVEIPPGKNHRFVNEGKREVILVECSTPHDDADVVRLEQGE